MNTKRKIDAVVMACILLCVCATVFVHIFATMPLGYLGDWFFWFTETHAFIVLLLQTVIIVASSLYIASLANRRERRFEEIASVAEDILPANPFGNRPDKDEMDPTERLCRVVTVLTSELRDSEDRARRTERRIRQQYDDLKNENERLKKTLALRCERTCHYRGRINSNEAKERKPDPNREFFDGE